DERTHLVPIVLVTGLVAREDRIQGIAAGCDDFLTKPVDSEQLIARTRNLLRTKSLVDELEQAENVLVSLANALDAKDNYTRGHAERGARYARRRFRHSMRPSPISAPSASAYRATLSEWPRRWGWAASSAGTCAARGCCTTSARSAPT